MNYFGFCNYNRYSNETKNVFFQKCNNRNVCFTKNVFFEQILDHVMYIEKYVH